MANLNKENIIEVDVKNATVTTKGSMKFYVTDIKTCNIYCQLVTNKSETPQLIQDFAPVENAEDFRVTMRLIKPNNEPKELDFIELKDSDAYFYVDLTDEYKDQAGIYKCELFVDCTVSGELERITTSSFTYEVKKSIWSDLDDILEGKPGTPLLERLATMAYVDNSISAIPESDLLNDFAQVSYVNESIDRYDNKILKQDYASREYVNERISDIRYDIGAAGYATSLSVNESISTLRTNIIDILTNNYAPLSYVDNAITNVMNGINLSDYATHTYVSNFFNNSIDSRLTDYATKDYVGGEIRELSRSMLNYSDIKGYMEDYLWVNEYTTKEDVNEAILNAQLGGEGGSVDLSAYATKTYVDEAIANIDTSGGGVSQQEMAEHVNSRLQEYDEAISTRHYATTEYVDGIMPVIDKMGTGEEILYEDFAVSGTYKLNGTMRINNTFVNFNNELVFVMKVDLPIMKRLVIYRTASRGNKEAMADYIVINYNKDTGEISSVSHDKYAYESYVDEKMADKADKSYVEASINSTLGDIESLLKEI